MPERILAIAAVLVVLVIGGAPALAAPAATVALDPSSDCEQGRLSITTSGISGGREYWRATSTQPDIGDTLLGEQERSGPATGYSGGLDFPFLTGPVPYGIAVTLYGYQGSTPPTSSTTAEFAVSYICETLEILSISAGPYGTVTILPISADIPTLSPSALLLMAAVLGIGAGWALRRRRVL